MKFFPSFLLSAVGKIYSDTWKKQLINSTFTAFNALTSVIIKVRKDALNTILTAGWLFLHSSGQVNQPATEEDGFQGHFIDFG